MNFSKKTDENNEEKETSPGYIPSVLQVFLLFLKIGVLGFGGGAAVISIIQQETVDKKKWISEEVYLQGLCISMLPPGAIMVNTSFFVGNVLRGFAGGMAAILGVLAPSFIIILALGILIVSVKSINIEGSGMISGLAPAVFGVLVAIIIRMSAEHIKKTWTVLLMALSALTLFYLKIPTYVPIIAAIVLGISHFLIAGMKLKKMPASDLEERSDEPGDLGLETPPAGESGLETPPTDCKKGEGEEA